MSPARMTIANVSRPQDEALEVQFNPSELTESLQVVYARQTVPGLSHQPMYYVNTGNVTVPLSLFYDSLAPGTTYEYIHDAKKFLQSLCYPKRGVSESLGDMPPRALLVWPNVLSLTTVVTELSVNYTQFNRDGSPSKFTARLTLEEIRSLKLFSEDVLVSGSVRPEVRYRVAVGAPSVEQTTVTESGLAVTIGEVIIGGA